MTQTIYKPGIATKEESVLITSIANAIAIYIAHDSLNFFRSNDFKEALKNENLCFINDAMADNGIMNDGMLAALLYMVLAIPVEFTHRNKKEYQSYVSELRGINEKLLGGYYGAKKKR